MSKFWILNDFDQLYWWIVYPMWTFHVFYCILVSQQTLGSSFWDKNSLKSLFWRLNVLILDYKYFCSLFSGELYTTCHFSMKFSTSRYLNRCLNNHFGSKNDENLSFRSRWRLMVNRLDNECFWSIIWYIVHPFGRFYCF